MKRIISLLLAILLPQFSRAQISPQSAIPSELRSGVAAATENVSIALAMQRQGWEYVMPTPKSPQAAWGNCDGRTTWWNGYWINRSTGTYSSIQPTLKDGTYIGDGINTAGWRRGGSPRRLPTQIEWLLSRGGGIPPR